jgi:hypothetical protein
VTDPNINWLPCHYCTKWDMVPDSNDSAVKFTVCEVEHMGEDGRAIFEGGEEDFHKVEPEITITVRWDGCMTVEHHVDLHFCTARDIDRYCAMLKAVREEAENLLAVVFNDEKKTPRDS